MVHIEQESEVFQHEDSEIIYSKLEEWLEIKIER
jgi:hypothetical protein